MNRLRSFSYNVAVKNADITISDEVSCTHSNDEDTSVITSVVVEDAPESRSRAEAAIGKISPYGIELTAKGDIENVKKIEPDVVQKHVARAIKKNTKKSK